jgi:hypothetical protein
MGFAGRLPVFCNNGERSVRLRIVITSAAKQLRENWEGARTQWVLTPTISN